MLWVFQHATACLFSLLTQHPITLMFDRCVFDSGLCGCVWVCVRERESVVCLCVTGLLCQGTTALCILLRRLFFVLKDSINLSEVTSEPHPPTHTQVCALNTFKHKVFTLIQTETLSKRCGRLTGTDTPGLPCELHELQHPCGLCGS
ncbi:hypothetical protein AMECASPLE_001183 [Ameca splendens]|uniref:Secreted protein n=1 Tax=Ameca splendens TaxID=208324 RepID=A0ABV0YXA3_9TELE